MTLKLYNFPQSTCSQKVRLVLWEKDLKFLDRQLDPAKREQLSDWYLELNPNGVVPTLMHDNAIIIDSSVIIEYLDEVFPETLLSPPDAIGRAQMRQWLRYFEEVATAAIRVPSFNKYLSKRFDQLSQEEFDAFAENHPIRKQFYKKMRKGEGFDQRETESATERLRQTVKRMEKGLSTSDGPWLMGEMLTLADYCIAPTLDRMRDLKLDDIWQDCTRVAAWFDRIQQRPAYIKTFYKRTRLSEIYDGASFGSDKNLATVVNE
ncbi:MAG: glutathione S-transferase family protein [Gammaproteobacteria bacterium]|nr:glutathione S-transferase family protein [Gammaproteobacteria bacterium]